MTGTGERYRVLRVTDSSNYTPQQGAHRTKQVHYQLADGTRSYIEMHANDYSPINVQNALEHAATVHEQVMSVAPGYSPPMDTSQNNPFA